MKRKVLLLRVIWFWELDDNKLVLFIDFECNVLEKEFLNCKLDYFGVVFDRVIGIKLLGLIKSVKVNFLKMIMVCSSNGIKSYIFRVLEGNEENIRCVVCRFFF